MNTETNETQSKNISDFQRAVGQIFNETTDIVKLMFREAYDVAPVTLLSFSGAFLSPVVLWPHSETAAMLLTVAAIGASIDATYYAVKWIADASQEARNTTKICLEGTYMIHKGTGK